MKKLLPVILIIIVIITVLWIFQKSTRTKEESSIIPTPTIVLPTISESVNVSLTAKNNNRTVVLKISNIPENTEIIEYELTYQTDSSLPRGVLGKITVAGDKEITRDDIVLGTCSSGKCVYDTGVKNVDLSLKFTSLDGQVSVFRNTYDL